MVTSKKTKENLLHHLVKLMRSITKFSAIGIPAIIGMGIAWVGNRLIKNENQIKDRELELKLQLNNKLN